MLVPSEMIQIPICGPAVTVIVAEVVERTVCEVMLVPETPDIEKGEPLQVVLDPVRVSTFPEVFTVI